MYTLIKLIPLRSQFIYKQCRNVNWNIADNKKGQRNMRLIKVTGGLGNQMFIYAFYLRMKSTIPKCV